jgi:hypothetical protein
VADNGQKQAIDQIVQKVLKSDYVEKATPNLFDYSCANAVMGCFADAF